jgi:hypothetical protein
VSISAFLLSVRPGLAALGVAVATDLAAEPGGPGRLRRRLVMDWLLRTGLLHWRLLF